MNPGPHNRTASLALAALLFAGGGCLAPRSSPSTSVETPVTPPVEDADTPSFDTLSAQKRPSNVVGTAPAHGAVFAGAPVNVVVDASAELGEGSSISVIFAGTDYGTGDTTVDASRRSVRRAVSADAPEGLYTVLYKTCWTDRTCGEGRFQFFIDRVQAVNFIDLRGRKEVRVRIVDEDFGPAKMRVSRGTRVTWVNEDGVAHSVHADPHPSHSYHPEMGSRTLRQDDEHGFVFSAPGLYSYHCDAHPETMTGEVLVD